MSKVKDFFKKVMGHVGYGSGTGGTSGSAATIRVGANRRTGPLYKSCRSRGCGVRRADGRWLSPWSLYLLRHEMAKAQDPALAHETPLSFSMVFGNRGLRATARYIDRRRAALQA